MSYAINPNSGTTPETLPMRPMGLHFIACYILQQWTSALGGESLAEHPELGAGQRFAPIMFLAASGLRRCGVELGVHGEFRNPDILLGLTFFKSNTITRVLHQSIEQGWILPTRNKLAYALTDDGRHQVLALGPTHIKLMWPLQVKLREGVRIEGHQMPINDSDILRVVDRSTQALYKAPDRELREQLKREAGRLAHAQDCSPYVDIDRSYYQ